MVTDDPETVLQPGAAGFSGSENDKERYLT